MKKRIPIILLLIAIAGITLYSLSPGVKYKFGVQRIQDTAWDMGNMRIDGAMKLNGYTPDSTKYLRLDANGNLVLSSVTASGGTFQSVTHAGNTTDTFFYQTYLGKVIASYLPYQFRISDTSGNYYVQIATAPTGTTGSAIRFGFPGAEFTSIFPIPSTGHNIDSLQDGSGILAFTRQIPNIQSIRQPTGLTSTGSLTLVTLTWPVPFADTKYTPEVSLLDPTNSNLSLSIIHIQTQTASQIQVLVYNSSAGSLQGTVNATAVHD